MKTEVMKHEQYGEVRTVILDAVKYFAGRDVVKALGYKKPDLFLNKHVKAEDKRLVMLHSLPLSPSSVMRNTVVVNNNGVAALCDAAFCDAAADIKHWLLKEDKARPDALTLFDDAEYGQFRWIIIDGEVWFVAVDMCRILGLQNPRDAVANLDDDEKSSIVLPKNGVTNTVGSNDPINDATCGWIENRVNVVNEFGLYRLIMASRKPHAKKFQRKVYHEILPAINRQGYYSVKEPAKKIRKPVPELAVVYAVLLSNMLVKIGMTRDLTARLKDLQKETKADIIAWVSTSFMTRDAAALLERSLKVKFFDKNKGGEFYAVDFDTVKAALLATPADKLLDIAREMEPSPEKNQLLLRAANLLK